MDTQTFKTTLQELHTQIVDELKTIGVEDPVTHDWVAVPESSGADEPDPNINADTTEDWNERRAIISQLETRYRNITRALEKIDAGTYGACEICNEPIEEDRLTVNPAARTCKTHLDAEDGLPL